MGQKTFCLPTRTRVRRGAKLAGFGGELGTYVSIGE